MNCLKLYIPLPILFFFFGTLIAIAGDGTSDAEEALAQKKKLMENTGNIAVKNKGTQEGLLEVKQLQSVNDLDFEKIYRAKENLSHFYQAIHTDGMEAYVMKLLKEPDFKHAPMAKVMLYAMGDDETGPDVKASYDTLNRRLRDIVDELKVGNEDMMDIIQRVRTDEVMSALFAGIALRHRGDLSVFRDALRVLGKMHSSEIKPISISEKIRPLFAEMILTGTFQDLYRKLAIEYLVDEEVAVRLGAAGVVFGFNKAMKLKENAKSLFDYDYRKTYKANSSTIKSIGRLYAEEQELQDEKDRQVQLHHIGGPPPQEELNAEERREKQRLLYQKWRSAKTPEQKKDAALAWDRISKLDPMWDFGMDYPGKKVNSETVRRKVGITLKRYKLLREHSQWKRKGKFFRIIKNEPAKSQECFEKRLYHKVEVLKIKEGMPGWKPHVDEGVTYMEYMDNILKGKSEPIFETFPDVIELAALYVCFENLLNSKTLTEFNQWNRMRGPISRNLADWNSSFRMSKKDEYRKFNETVCGKVVESLKARKVTAEELGELFAKLYLCREYYRELNSERKLYRKNKNLDKSLKWTREKEDKLKRLSLLNYAVEGDYYTESDLTGLATEYRKHIEKALSANAGIKLEILSPDKDVDHDKNIPHLDRYCRILALVQEWREPADYIGAIESHFTFFHQREVEKSFYLPRKYNLDEQKAFPKIMNRFRKLRTAYLKAVQM